MFNSFLSFFRKSYLYDIMWNKMVQSDRPQMTIRRMQTACWIPKATNTDSQYVPNSLLLFHSNVYAKAPQPYIACLVNSYVI